MKSVYGNVAIKTFDDMLSFCFDFVLIHPTIFGMCSTSTIHTLKKISSCPQKKHKKQAAHLKYAGAVRGSPRAQVVVVARRYEPLARRANLSESSRAVLVQIHLVLVRLARVQHLHVAALHAHGEPVAGRAAAERSELVLAELEALAHIPGAHRVVKAAREDAKAVGRDGEPVAGGRLRAQLALGARHGRRRQVLDADYSRLAAHDERAAVGQ